MSDNAAARANFEELRGHIDLASRRIRALAPGTESHSQTLEDLEDYYERTVQLRKMQAQTALCERDEARAFGMKVFLIMTILVFGLLILLCVQFAWLAPDAAHDVWTTTLQPYATVDRFVLLLITLSSLTLWRLNRNRIKAE